MDPIAKPNYVAGNPDASRHWDTVIGRLVGIKPIDTDALAEYCCAFAEVRRLEGVLMIEGDTITNPETGVTKIHPLLSQLTAARQRFDRLRRDLRLTPDSRNDVIKPPHKSLMEVLKEETETRRQARSDRLREGHA